MLLLTIGLSGCDTTPRDRDIIESNIEAYLLEKMNDPSSLQWHGVSSIDTFYQSVSEQSEYYVSKKFKTFNEKEAMADSLEAVLRERELNGEVTHYVASASFRSKNKLGALVLTDCLITISPDFEIIGVKQN